MKKLAGLDWGSAKHAACVIDEQGQVVAQLDVEHTADGLKGLLRELARFAIPEQLPIAIERPSGLLVDTLLDAGHPVVPIHPNALQACRPRYRAAGGKSDPGDAFSLADVLRTDGHRFRPLRPVSDEVKALRALVRSRDDLVAERVALANQLRALLDSFWPGAGAIFSDIDSPIALDFLARYPTPTRARSLGEKRLARFLARNGYSGRRSPEELLARLRAAPTGLAGPLEQEAKGEAVVDLVSILRTVVERIRRLTSAVEHAVAQLATGQVVMSFPRAGKVNAAQIVAELGDDRERFQTDDQLAAEAGVAPVTHATPPVRAAASSSATPATSDSGVPSRSGPTTPATRAPGPGTSTPTPALVAAITPTPPASWHAPGCASCGGAGATVRTTSRPFTELPRLSSRPPEPTTAESLSL